MNKLFSDLRNSGIRRTDDALLGGVCAGLAHRWNIAPIIIRLSFLFLLFFGGAAFLIYGAAWLLIPSFPENRIELEQAAHGNPGAATAGALSFIIIGIFSLSTVSTGILFFLGAPSEVLFLVGLIVFPTAFIAAAVLLIQNSRKKIEVKCNRRLQNIGKTIRTRIT
ncbi:PspC domain-containing protein [Arcanobacterium hippocoleae]